MARIIRTRSRNFPYPSGSYVLKTNAGLTTGYGINRTYSSSITDFVGRPVVDSALTSSQYLGTPPTVSGTVIPSYTISNNSTTYYDYCFTALPSEMTGMSTLSAPAGWMLDLVAGTNPSRPVLKLPEMVENIVSLPKMLKSLGDILMSPKSVLSPKKAAGTYLGVQFGWLPLIEDLQKLANLQQHVIKRSKELNQLYSGKGLRRRLKFRDDTATYAYTSNWATYANARIKVNCSLTIKRRTWGSIHWKPTAPPPYHPDDESQNAFVRRIALGATPEGLANGLWAVIPWTWLIGWFTNVGKYTLAHSWTVPATHGTGCFMSEAVATYVVGGCSVTEAKSSSLSATGKVTRTVKTRSVSSSVVAGANVPFVDPFRLSILSSLFIQRFYPGRR